MSRLPVLFFSFLLIFFLSTTFAQSQPASDPQALAYAAQAIAALTGTTTVSDITLTGSVSWNGPGADTGTATLRALGTGSRMDLALLSGTRTVFEMSKPEVHLGNGRIQTTLRVCSVYPELPDRCGLVLPAPWLVGGWVERSAFIHRPGDVEGAGRPAHSVLRLPKASPIPVPRPNSAQWIFTSMSGKFSACLCNF